MTICIVSDTYPFSAPFGGIAVFTRTAARALSERGHKVHVLIPCNESTRDLTDGAVHIHYRHVRWMPLVGRFVPALGESYGVARALRELHERHRFDIVEFPNFEGIGLVAQWRDFAPFVVRLHTSMAESVEVQHREPRLGERFMMWAEKQSARRACGVVTHSLAHRDRLAKIYDLSGIHIIPHGIALPACREAEPAAPAVLTLGRLSARKGGPTLLSAIPLIHAAVPGATFTVVGASEAHPLVRGFRQEHPQIPRESVVFHEFISGEELNALFAAATVYASASVYESFGLTFIEAMARGVPVVGCATSAMNENIAHEGSGLLVPPLDPAAFAAAVVRLLRDPALRRRFGAAGRHSCEERFTAARMAAEIEAWYLSVLARR